VADNTVWSHWQVASRSSEVNFTKNYMLLYLFFTFKAKTITLEYLDGTQREREPPPRLILHAGVSVIQCCRDFPRAAIQTPFVDYCFTKQWTKSGLILNERKHFLPTEEITSLRPSSWILGEVGVGSKGDERNGREGIRQCVHTSIEISGSALFQTNETWLLFLVASFLFYEAKKFMKIHPSVIMLTDGWSNRGKNNLS